MFEVRCVKKIVENRVFNYKHVLGTFRYNLKTSVVLNIIV